jgi:hypothetical protein
MQPAISQALMATRVADLHRQAQIAQLARDVKRDRRQARRARMHLVRGVQPTRRPERAGLGAVSPASHAARP